MAAVDLEGSAQLRVKLSAIAAPIEGFQLSYAAGDLQRSSVGVEWGNGSGGARAGGACELATDLT